MLGSEKQVDGNKNRPTNYMTGCLKQSTREQTRTFNDCFLQHWTYLSLQKGKKSYEFVLRQMPSTSHTVVSFLIRAPLVTTAYIALAPLLTHKHRFTLPPCRGTTTIIIIRIITIDDDDNQGMMEQHCPSVWHLMMIEE